MKIRLLFFSVLLTGSLWAQGDATPAVKYFSHEEVAAVLSHSGTLMRQPDFLIMGSHRAEAGHVEMHEQRDGYLLRHRRRRHLRYGRQDGGRPRQGQGQWMGTDIVGGEVHHLIKGDVIVIRAGTPHWFKEVPHSVNYFVVKVLTQ